MSDPEVWVGATLILALSTLTEKERDAVVSHHIRGEAVATIAAREDVGLKAIYLRLDKGMTKLRTELEPLRDELLAA